jgi:hypothetical protein
VEALVEPLVRSLVEALVEPLVRSCQRELCRSYLSAIGVAARSAVSANDSGSGASRSALVG